VRSDKSKKAIHGEDMPMSEALRPTPRVKSIQRTALAMLVVAGVINYVDRATLAVANPLIRQDLGLSIADMGYLLSAFCGPMRLRNCPQAPWSTSLGLACC
jgi:sugar phosphate permease